MEMNIDIRKYDLGSQQTNQSFVHPQSQAVENRIMFLTPHPKVYSILGGIYCWMLACYASVFWNSPVAIFMVAISTAFFLLYAGTPIIPAKLSKLQFDDGKPFEAFLNGEMQIFTGKCSGWAAFIQITIVPFAVAIAVSCITLVIAAYR